MPTNNFLTFCPTDTGTNLTAQADYAVDADRTSGNKPGIARSALNNKALRQANFLTSQLAQLISDQTVTDLLDDADTVSLLAKMNAVVVPIAPVVTKYTTGSGSHNISYVFFITSANATIGATYTNNSVTFTVSATIAAQKKIILTGSGAPLASGTLTKSGGTGDSTITFHAVRAPISINVKMVGGGGGGGGGGAAGAADGGAGGNSTFGTTLLVANGGGGGKANVSGNGGAGGTASLGTGPFGVAVSGASGSGGQTSGTAGVGVCGGSGGNTPFGGGGGGGTQGTIGGQAAATNSGSGGGGGGGSAVPAGAGGGAGGYVDAIINTPLSTYAYAVGAAGSAGAHTGAGAGDGAAGAVGVIVVVENFQ